MSTDNIRMKTREEFLAEGWRATAGGGDLMPPAGVECAGGCVAREMIDKWQDFLSPENLGELAAGARSVHGRRFSWGPTMFVFGPPPPPCTCGAEKLRLFHHHPWCNHMKGTA